MAEGSSGASAILGVIVGALIVVGVAVYAFGGFNAGGGGSTSVNITSSAPASGGGGGGSGAR